MRPAGTPVTRQPRRWGRGLVVLAAALVCAVPATDALAASRGRSAPAARPKASATAQTKVKNTPQKIDLEKEAVRRGWAWGNAVRGQVVLPARGGLQTLQFQRGVVTDVTDTTVVVTSADGVSMTWTLTSSTAVVVPNAVERRRAARVTAAVETTPTSDPTTPTSDPTTPTSDPTTPATDPSGPILTGKLGKNLQIRVWGVGAGASPAARLVIADPKAPKPKLTTTTTAPTTTPTTTTPTTTLPPD